MVCTSSCRRSFLTASHYMSDTYAWFGCAYFVYDMWSMYEVHVQKIADKRQLMLVRSGDSMARLYDAVDARQSAQSRSHRTEPELNDADMALLHKRLKQVAADERTTFLGYCAANPVMTMHHVFLQSFGLYVIVVSTIVDVST